MAFKTLCNKIMKRKVGVSGQFFFNDNTWIKPEDSENLAKNQKMEEQTSFNQIMI